MEYIGINWGLAAAQLINLGLTVVWIVYVVKALRQLGQRRMPESHQLGWALVILLVPILGALAFFLAKPGAATEHA